MCLLVPQSGSHSSDLIAPQRKGPKQAGVWSRRAVTQVQTGAGDILRASRAQHAAPSTAGTSPGTSRELSLEVWSLVTDRAVSLSLPHVIQLFLSRQIRSHLR